jgi:hypothetical protein
MNKKPIIFEFQCEFVENRIFYVGAVFYCFYQLGNGR